MNKHEYINKGEKIIGGIVMNEKEIYAKLKKITRELFEKHELEYSWYVDSQSNIDGELKNAKIPWLKCYVFMSIENLENCSVRMCVDDLQYIYTERLLKSLKLSVEIY